MDSYGVVKALDNYDFGPMREKIREQNRRREEDEENAEFAMSENPYISPISTHTLRRKYNSIAHINESRRRRQETGGKKCSYKRRNYKKRSCKKRGYKKRSCKK